MLKNTPICTINMQNATSLRGFFQTGSFVLATSKVAFIILQSEIDSLSLFQGLCWLISRALKGYRLLEEL